MSQPDDSDDSDDRDDGIDPSLPRTVATAQRWIENIYRLDLDLRAEHYLVSPEAARALLPPGSPKTGLVIIEETDGISVGLYVDPDDAQDPHAVIEETSHLLYLAWHAVRDLRVTRLVLELQSEVDRYAVSRLRGLDGMKHFEQFEWASWMDAQIRDRYEQAHRSARRYCRALDRRFPKRSDTPGLLAELRRYYRAAPEQKLNAVA